MGYFPNGSAGDYYMEKFCSRCRHADEEGNPDCAVWDAHLLRNYEDCNDKDSLLHVLIPRDPKGFNEQCRMFLPADG
jgi:hypothetical protein